MGFNLSGRLSYMPVKVWKDYDAVKNRYKQMVFLVEFGN